MKAKCSSCIFFRKYDPEYGEESECTQTPGYNTLATMDACAFYEKKGRKVTPKQERRCTKCSHYIRNPHKKDGDCVRNGELFVNNPRKSCSFYEEKKVVKEKRSKATAECSTDCRHWYEEIGKCRFGHSHTPNNCSAFAFNKKEQKKQENLPLGCPYCSKAIPKETTQRADLFPLATAVCTGCEKKFALLRGLDSKHRVVRLEEEYHTPVDLTKHGVPACTECGELVKGQACYQLGSNKPLCKECWDKLLVDKGVTETPIHERFLVVEGSSCGVVGAWVSTYLFIHPTQEEAITALGQHNPQRDGQTCKLYRVSSSAPIELEELSLGYDIKVVKKVKR